MTTYLNGKRHVNVFLSVDEIESLIGDISDPPDGRDPATDTALERLALHRDGPPDEIHEIVEEHIADGVTWPTGVNGDRQRIVCETSRHGRTVVNLEVCPDGDVDDYGRLIDCTHVSATWLVDAQSVDFDLDDTSAHDLIDQWRRHNDPPWS
jgi:hypothetical protein